MADRVAAARVGGQQREFHARASEHREWFCARFRESAWAACSFARARQGGHGQEYLPMPPRFPKLWAYAARAFERYCWTGALWNHSLHDTVLRTTVLA